LDFFEDFEVLFEVFFEVFLETFLEAFFERFAVDFLLVERFVFLAISVFLISGPTRRAGPRERV